jgi:hypothetical protein
MQEEIDMTNRETSAGRPDHGADEPDGARGLPTDETRAFAERLAREATAAALEAVVTANRFAFLHAELLTGNTMLDAAEVTLQGSTRDRRYALAREAHDVVARHLARGPALGLSVLEWDDVSDGLAHLKARLDACPPR